MTTKKKHYFEDKPPTLLREIEPSSDFFHDGTHYRLSHFLPDGTAHCIALVPHEVRTSTSPDITEIQFHGIARVDLPGDTQVT